MSMKFWFIIFILCGLTGCGSTEDATRSNNFVPLTAIEMTSANPAIANLTSNQFTALGNFSGQFTRDITADVTWSSSDPTVATVSNLAGSNGRAEALTAGTTTITASLDGVVASFTLSVSAATIAAINITPLTPSVAKGLSTRFTATGTFSDASNQDISTDVVWTSGDALIASVSNVRGSEGQADALTVGSTDVSASFEGVTATTLMTVTAAQLQSINLSPGTRSMVSLATLSYTATGTFSDGNSQDLSSQASWSSSFPDIATIDSGGLVTTLASGKTTLTAVVSGLSATAVLTVTGGNLTTINIGPTLTKRLVNGTSGQFEATGIFDNGNSRDITALVTWSSSDPTVATVSNLPGLEGRTTTVAAGTSTLTATFDLISKTKLLTVETAQLNSLSIHPTVVDMPDSTSQQFTVTGNFAGPISQDVTLDAAWSSTNPTVAEISTVEPDKGLVSAVSVGTTTISADFGGVTPASTSLNVSSLTLQSLAINPLNPLLSEGKPVNLTLTATYLGGTTRDVSADAVWVTADSSVADFLASDRDAGLLTGIAVGTTDITATFGGQSVRVTADVR